ncbi:hypothetical protein [Bosea lathyri]|nr:hypothetical protein [Bosea lathyri]
MAANREIAAFGESARRAGVEVERFQSLRLAGANEGIAGKAFDSGLQGLAKALNDSRREETELSKLLDANNIKVKSRTGEIISTNEALAIAADLISRAATEQDKIEIAKRFGLPADFVPLLEGGAAALERLARNAADAGTILSSEVIDKAKQFDQAWDTAWNAFTSNAKASVTQAGLALAEVISKAVEFQNRMENARRAGAGIGQTFADLSNGKAPAAPNEAVPTATSAPFPPSRPSGVVVGRTTAIPTKATGGGGGGKTEEETAQARLEKYIETLMRQNSVLDAEVATFGKSNAEKRAAVELAKAQVDLAKLDETERQKIITSLTREIELSEQKRKTLADLKAAQDGLRDAQKFFGDAAVDALEDLIVNGKKAEDVVKNLAASLAKAALQAALMGSGPLAGLFGLKGENGATGGLFGSLFSGNLFGRATGGPVNAGQPYRVGERGPETFVPTSPGKIVPAGRGGGSMALTVSVVGARGNAEIEQMVQSGIVSGLKAYDANFDRRLGEARYQSARRSGRY